MLGAIFEAKLTCSASSFLLFSTARFIIFCSKCIEISRFNFGLKNNVTVLWTDNLPIQCFIKKCEIAEKIDIKSVYDLHSYRTSISAILDSPEDLTVYWSYRSSVYRVQWNRPKKSSKVFEFFWILRNLD